MPSDEIMMPVAKPDALAHAEIHALRQISDNLTAQTRQIERMNEKLDDVRERVIALEQSGFDRRLESLKGTLDKFELSIKADLKAIETRVDKMESAQDQVRGAVTFWSWLGKNFPWLVAMGVAAAAAVGLKK